MSTMLPVRAADARGCRCVGWVALRMRRLPMAFEMLGRGAVSARA